MTLSPTSVSNTTPFTSTQQVMDMNDDIFYGFRIAVIAIVSILDISSNIVALVVIPRTDMPPNSKLVMTSMCAANLVIGFLAAFNIYPAIVDKWPYGDIMCNVLGIVTQGFIILAVSSVIFLSMDRYIAITKPLRHRVIVTRRRLGCLIGASWTFPFFSITVLYFTKRTRVYDSDRCACYRVVELEIASIQSTDSKLKAEIVVAIGLTLVQSFLLIFIYLRIFCVAKSQNKAIQRNREVKSSDKKVLKMLATTTFAYIVAWPPLFVIDIILVVGYEVSKWVIFSSFWLSLSSSWIQVACVAATSASFRHHCLKVLRCQTSKPTTCKSITSSQ